MRLYPLFMLVVLCHPVVTHAQYSNLVIHDGRCWALDRQGTIAVFDLKTEKRKIIKAPAMSGIQFLTTDRKGEMVVVDNNGEVKVLDSRSSSWRTLSKVNREVMGLVFTSNNSEYAITQKGIVDIATKKAFFKGSSLNNQIHYRGEWPVCTSYFIDRGDNIWIGFGFGEWGGDLVIFDTKAQRFVTPRLGQFQIDLFPVKSIFEDDRFVYVSCGLAHMDFSGCIVKFDRFNGSYLLLSDTKRERVAGTNRDSIYYGEYIGPATFSKKQNAFYFYSNHGIFKGDARQNLASLSGWTKLVQPKLKWKSGQRDALGPPMNVLELKVLDEGTVVFASQSDGVGVYRNGVLKMMK